MSKGGLKISVEDRGDISCVALDGYLDAHTFEQFETCIEDIFRKDRYRLLIDLKKLRYVSSAGAGVFISSLGTCQDHDGNIALVRPTPEVKEIFDLLGVFHIFPIADTVENALTALST